MYSSQILVIVFLGPRDPIIPLWACLGHFLKGMDFAIVNNFGKGLILWLEIWSMEPPHELE